MMLYCTSESYGYWLTVIAVGCVHIEVYRKKNKSVIAYRNPQQDDTLPERVWPSSIKTEL